MPWDYDAWPQDPSTSERHILFGEIIDGIMMQRFPYNAR